MHSHGQWAFLRCCAIISKGKGTEYLIPGVCRFGALTTGSRMPRCSHTPDRKAAKGAEQRNQMALPLRVLIVEDSKGDANLIVEELRRGGCDPQSEWVDTREGFSAALANQVWDVIIADHFIPGFGGLDALEMAQESGLDLPFIIVSGVMGEDTAVAALKAGAHDYVMKNNLARLWPAVQRALQESEMRLARQQAEETLRESEERYRSIIEGIEDGYYEVDLAGNFTFLNDAMCRLIGRPRQELMGLNNREYMDEETARQAYQTFSGVYRTGEPTKTFGWEIVREDGSRRAIETSVSLVRDRAGEPIGFRGIVRDITGHRRAQEALQRSEKHFRALIENASDVIMILDEDGVICYGSPSIRRMLGYGPEEVLGKQLAELAHQDDVPIVTRSLNHVFLNPGAIAQLELHIRHKDGSWQAFEAIANNLLDDPAVEGVVINARQITERKRAQETSQLRVEQLAALSQASQAVTASLELNQVLAEIVSLASEVTASEYSAVVLVDEVGNVGPSAEDLPGVPALEYRIRDQGLTSWIVHSHRALVVDEIGEDGVISPDLGEGAPCFANPFLVEAGVKSLVGLPLMVKERLLGVLYLHSMCPDAFGGQLFLLTAFANQVAIAIENARLFEVEQQQTRRLALLADIARVVATTFDADTLLQAVAESTHRHFAYPMIEIYTPDEGGKTLRLRGYSLTCDGASELPAPEGYHHTIDEGIIGHVARTRTSYLAPDVSIDPHHQAPPGFDIRSEACVPILDNERLVGVIDVESDRLADLDEGDLSLLEAVADTVVIGLRNARLYLEAQQRVRELTLLNSISSGFGVALNLDGLINGALDGLHKLVNADRTYFITADADARTWETTHEQVAPGIEPDIGLSGAFEDVPVELETMMAGEPFAVTDIATDPRVEATREMYISLGMESVLMVPVQVAGYLYGALGFDFCREKHTWQADEVRLLEAVAQQLGLGLENARLFEEVRLRADELAAALMQLEEMDRLKDQFVQNVSHEFRSPLALIRGYAAMLDVGELGELRTEQRQAVAVIARRARMLSDLVEDITLLLEAEVSPPEPEAVALEELTRIAVEDFQVAIEQAELTLDAEIPPHLPPVSNSLTYLRRVLDNLLGNAVKFTPAGGRIGVLVRQEGEQIALEVSDTGVGIPTEKLEHIFERFYQVDGSARRRYGGVGLGLSLVKEIVEAYGGRITVESQLGQGSTFTVYLPIAHGAE